MNLLDTPQPPTDAPAASTPSAIAPAAAAPAAAPTTAAKTRKPAARKAAPQPQAPVAAVTPPAKAVRKAVPKAAPKTPPKAPSPPVTKPAAQPVAKSVVKPVKVPKPPKAPKPAKMEEAKPTKVKLVRDTFTFPTTDYEQLAALKKRALALGQDVKKGELVRAGLALLSALGDAALKASIGKVERLKTGRPKK